MKPAMTESSLSIRSRREKRLLRRLLVYQHQGVSLASYRGVRLSSLLRGLGLLWVSLMLM